MGSINEYSERETWMLDHQSQISIPATVTRGPVFLSAVIPYSVTYDATDVVDNDNLATELSAQIQISIALIGMVRKLSLESIVLTKRWGISPEKAQKYKPQCKEGFRTMLHPLLSRRFKANNRNLCYHWLAHPVFSTWCLSVQFPEGATDVHKYMPQTFDGLEFSQWHPVVKQRNDPR